MKELYLFLLIISSTFNFTIAINKDVKQFYEQFKKFCISQTTTVVSVYLNILEVQEVNSDLPQILDTNHNSMSTNNSLNKVVMQDDEEEE